jgi:hypothetical protein
MKNKILLLSLAVMLVAIGAVGCPPKPVAPPAAPPGEEVTPPPEEEVPIYAAEPLENGVIIGDFRIALSRVERRTDSTTLFFAIRALNPKPTMGEPIRVGIQLTPRERLLDVRVIDDRGNVYTGPSWCAGIIGGVNWPSAVSRVGGRGIIPFSSVPVGFTWLTDVQVKMPKAAPIERIKIVERRPSADSMRWVETIVWAVDYPNYRLVSPDIDAELGERVLSTGEKIAQGKDIKWSIGEIREAEGRWGKEWHILFDVANADYSPRGVNLVIRFQQPDGTIRDASGVWLRYPRVRHPEDLEGGFILTPARIGFVGDMDIKTGAIEEEIPAQTQRQFTYRLLLGERPAPAYMLIYNDPPGELYIFKVSIP